MTLFTNDTSSGKGKPDFCLLLWVSSGNVLLEIDGALCAPTVRFSEAELLV